MVSKEKQKNYTFFFAQKRFFWEHKFWFPEVISNTISIFTDFNYLIGKIYTYENSYSEQKSWFLVLDINFWPSHNLHKSLFKKKDL